MSDSAGLKRSQALSKFVQEYHVNKWKQIGRTMPEAKPTPIPVNFLPSDFVDISAISYQKLASILRLVGIQPLSGESIGSPMQRLHISSQIAQLNRFLLPGMPQLSSMEDIALLDGAQQQRLKTAKQRADGTEPPPPSRPRPSGAVPGGQLDAAVLRGRAARASADKLLKSVQKRRARDILGAELEAGRVSTLIDEGEEGAGRALTTPAKERRSTEVRKSTARKDTTRAKRKESKTSKTKAVEVAAKAAEAEEVK
jgi:hypothetical protein